MGELRMPSLGADMEAGTIVEWLVGPGDAVRRGDVVATVETEKADLDVEVFEDGVVQELLVPVGVKVPVGTPLARLETVAQRPRRRSTARAPVPKPAAPAVPSAAPIAPTIHSPVVRHLAEELHVDLATVRGTGPGGVIRRADVEHAGTPRFGARVSPRARRLAREHHIDASAVTGTGPGGAVTGDDILRAPATRPPGRRTAAERIEARRRAIGELMTRSWTSIPHYHLRRRIDLSRVEAFLDEHNAAHPPDERLLPAALLLKATAVAAGRFPGVNGWYGPNGFEPAEQVDLGVVVALREGGLVTPVIRDVARRPVADVMADLRDLATRVRAGRLRATETTGATITVTNLGDLGVDEVDGVIFPPQVALVGFGAVREEAWAEDGLVSARPVVHATFTGDHRVSDGRVGAQVLTTLERLLQRPEEL